MKHKLLALLLGSSIFCGCSIRATANLETGDAVYGKTKMEKDQAYDSETNRKLSLTEAVAGTINPDILKRRESVPTPVLP